MRNKQLVVSQDDKESLKLDRDKSETTFCHLQEGKSKGWPHLDSLILYSKGAAQKHLYITISVQYRNTEPVIPVQ